MYFLLGLEKSLGFPRGPRSREVSKGRKLGSSSMGWAWAGTSLLTDNSPGEKGRAWWGRALRPWLPALLGSASDHLAVCLVDSGLDRRKDSPRAESPVKNVSLPDSEPQISPAQSVVDVQGSHFWSSSTLASS